MDYYYSGITTDLDIIDLSIINNLLIVDCITIEEILIFTIVEMDTKH
jgi:hypothetical protein